MYCEWHKLKVLCVFDLITNFFYGVTKGETSACVCISRCVHDSSLSNKACAGTFPVKC